MKELNENMLWGIFYWILYLDCNLTSRQTDIRSDSVSGIVSNSSRYSGISIDIFSDQVAAKVL